MKKFYLTLIIVFSLFQLTNAQWLSSGNNIYNSNTGNVGIGTTNPASNLEIKGSTAFDASTIFRITNNTGDYGRSNLIITGRIENGNDSWFFGSGARNSIVFAENAAASGVNIGAIGDEKFSIQLEGNSNSLGFLSKQNGNTPNMIINQSGSVGIGTVIPNTLLDVRGGALSIGNGNLDPNYTNLNYLANTGRILIGQNRTAGANETDFIANQGVGSPGGFAFYNHDNNNNETQLMWILGNGQVLIGNTQGKQGSYMLAVAGSAIATSMTVKNVGNWPDYVLKGKYSLPPLNEIKNYIDQNHHLPEIPSAQEIDKNGLDLGKMNRLLVKKVEELTLYMIEKDKEIKEQQMINKQSSEQMKLQQREIDELKTIIKSKIPNDKKSY